jgi:hypothetical protein
MMNMINTVPKRSAVTNSGKLRDSLVPNMTGVLITQKLSTQQDPKSGQIEIGQIAMPPAIPVVLFVESM